MAAIEMQDLGVPRSSTEAISCKCRSKTQEPGRRDGTRSVVKRACNTHHVICRRMQSRRKDNGRHQTSAKYCAALCPKIVTPYPRRREINRPDHVAAFPPNRVIPPQRRHYHRTAHL